jgi:hypothetical protein
MEPKNYLMIDLATNVVDNNVIWDGNTQTWQPPENHIWFVDEETEAMTWVLNDDKTDWVLAPVLGAGGIGFTWNGTILTTPEPKPAPPAQPTSSGTQTL